MGLLPFVGVPVRAAAASPDLLDVGVSVAGRPLTVADRGPDPDDAVARTARLSAPKWPQPGVAVLDLATAGRQAGAQSVGATLGVSVSPVGAESGARAFAAERPVGAVRVQSFDHAAAGAVGAVGHVFSLTRADSVLSGGHVRVSVDYSPYAQAFGGSVADRLRLVELPACAVKTPQVAKCTANPRRVESVNDLARGVLSAVVGVGGDQIAAARANRSGVLADESTAVQGSGTVLAVMSVAEGGSTGSYKATELKPSDEWQIGLSSGGFSYSYPLPEPPLPYGSPLGLSLSYSSSGVDGVTGWTNNQGGWAGLGWSFSPGYIERTYYSCKEDYPSDGALAGEMCWESPDKHDGETGTDDILSAQMTISLNGQATKLVKTTDGKWRTKDDFGWKVENLAGGAESDGYWLVSTPDGAKYRFGFVRDAVWKMNFLGDDPGEPCNSAFTGSCQDPWRWNLDQIVDRNENQTNLFWTREVNYYKRAKTGSILDYDRGGYLDRIEYGRNDTVAGSIPVGKVEFTSVNRCVERTLTDDVVANPYPANACPTQASSPSSYPDVPADLLCSATSCGNYSQAFFTSTRLDMVTSYTWNPVTNGWENISRVQARYKFINPPGLTGEVLFLDYLRPIGLIGDDATKIALPVVNFDSRTDLDGRVDYDEDGLGVAALRMPRLLQIYNGFGGKIEITYGRKDPCPDGGSNQPGYSTWYNTKVGNWDVNTEDCYNIFHTPEDSNDSGFGIFHKYLVTKVVYKDLVGGSPDQVTQYDYSQSTATWAHPRSPFVADSDESWSDWRGYGKVRVLQGSGTDPSQYTVETHTFFQGMYYDRKDDDTLKQTMIKDFDDHWRVDHYAVTGRTLQVQRYKMLTYNSDPTLATYDEVGSTRYEYGYPLMGDGPGYNNSYRTFVTLEKNREKVTGGGWRETQKTTTYDNVFWQPETVTDHGNLADTADDTCTNIYYARNEALYLLDYPDTVITREGSACNTQTPGAEIGRTITYYDGSIDTGPLQYLDDGNPTWVKTYSASNKYTATESVYDNFGRVTSATDAAGKTTTTTYNPAVNWPENGIVTAGPIAGHQTTIFMSRYQGGPFKTIDANGKVTELKVDRLGRTTEVLLPGETAGQGSLRFAYQITYDGGIGQPTAPARTQTEKLVSGAGNWASSFTYLDGRGRTREVQTASPAGGRIVSVTTYDARGNVAATGDPVHNASAAGSGLLNPALTALPAWHKTTYDHLSRPISVADYSTTASAWRQATTTYYGDRVETVPPAGGTRTIAYLDVNGKTTKLEQYTTATIHQDTVYTYDLLGRMTAMTDPAGNDWTYAYDWAGRMTTAVDPDAGTTTTAYDSAGRVDYTQGPLGKVSNKYDDLSRVIERWSGPVGTGGTKLASYLYDTIAKGQLTSATRYDTTGAYVTGVTGYNNRYQPTGNFVTVPAGVMDPAVKTYQTNLGYDQAGNITSMTVPGVGAAGTPLAEDEVITYGYDNLGYPTTVTSDYGPSTTTYVASRTYYNYGPLNRVTLGAAGAQVRLTNTINQGTGRLDVSQVDTESTTPGTFSDKFTSEYSYDAIGDVKVIAGRTNGARDQVECFKYDALRRMTEAWTNAIWDCGATKVPGGAGADPYWRQWTFDDYTGNRKTQVDKGAAADTTWTYTYPAPGAVRPHSLTSVAAAGPLAGTANRAFTYDNAGNTVNRQTDAGVGQVLNWNPEGHLATVTQGATTTEYVYDADGNRLLGKTGGKTTLYLGHTEIDRDSGTLAATRYYSADGQTIAVRDGAGLRWIVGDHHGTQQIQINSVGLGTTRNRTMPYGETRGSQGLFVGTRGYVGGTKDSTGLVHLGAREYDATLGRFISVDPVLDLTNPQQAHGYSYSGGNPTTFSDASGLRFEEETVAQYQTRVKHHEAGIAAARKRAEEAIRKIRELKIMGQDVSEQTYEAMRSGFGYSGSRSFTVGEAMDHLACMEAGRCVGDRGPEVFVEFVCRSMGGGGECSAPISAVEQAIADQVASGAGPSLPVVQALASFTDGNDKTGVEQLSSAAGTAPAIGAPIAAVGNISASYLEDNERPQLVFTRGAQFSSDGDSIIDGRVLATKKVWQHHQVIFPTPIAVFAVQARLDFPITDFIVGMQQVGFIS
ncbi:RHS repeat domain-containing protein [Catellatospora tritici]|uniref:RHS repeat domain-containing protein n=1 Tax=Catellatospora tritici TaxID=2851566 RepID=UPI001C2CD9FE|nr:RHS repeat-associated core domain-containing protein [Catellatospora tritici]MBV1850678.1 hypothetical protein [Catellatospora tritici]MBV1850931.1 hypothetical protein [Catellatospora tritici]